ncbi:MAG: hypothetical protein LBR79_05240 [Oscillospiraceae bacterium]|nr:hypothetical protein [Oscillospiraceae bacterium]
MKNKFVCIVKIIYISFPRQLAGCGSNLLIIPFTPRLWRGGKRSFNYFKI